MTDIVPIVLFSCSLCCQWSRLWVSLSRCWWNVDITPRHTYTTIFGIILSPTPWSILLYVRLLLLATLSNSNIILGMLNPRFYSKFAVCIIWFILNSANCVFPLCLCIIDQFQTFGEGMCGCVGNMYFIIWLDTQWEHMITDIIHYGSVCCEKCQ